MSKIREIGLLSGNNPDTFYVLDIAHAIYPFLGHWWVLFGMAVMGPYETSQIAREELEKRMTEADAEYRNLIEATLPVLPHEDI